MWFTMTSVLLLATFISARPEPPIDQYLPPPDQQYGPPSRNPSDFNGQSGQNNNNQYLPPSQQYGPPGGSQNSGYDDNSNNVNINYS